MEEQGGNQRNEIESSPSRDTKRHRRQRIDSMKPIASKDRIQTLGPHPEEAALFARPSRRMAAGTISPVAVLRDARKSALLRMRSEGLIRPIDACPRTICGWRARFRSGPFGPARP